MPPFARSFGGSQYPSSTAWAGDMAQAFSVLLNLRGNKSALASETRSISVSDQKQH